LVSFLTTALEIVNLGAGFLELGTGIKDTINPQQNKDIQRSQQVAFEIAEFIRDVTGAAVNPNDPRYQALIAESRQSDFANLLIGQQQRAIEDRRHVARGGQPTISDRDDARRQVEFRALDFPGVAAQRREAARSALINAANAARISGVPGDLAIKQEEIGANQRAGSIGSIGDAIEDIESSLPKVTKSFEDLFGITTVPGNLGGGRAGGVGGAGVSSGFSIRLPGEPKK